jgi:peptidoglycan/LPS O-acetylase OafA/YrhL
MEGLVGQLIFGSCSLALIVGCMGKAWVSRLLGSKPLVFGGKISYAFYLCHGFVIHRIEAAHLNPPIGMTFALCVIVSIFLYEAVERPARWWITSRP